MSLINEALKRAKQAQVPQAAPVVDPPLQPTLQAAAPPGALTWLAPALAAGILLLAVFFLSLWWRGSRRVSALEQRSTSSALDASNKLLPPAVRTTAPTSTSAAATPGAPTPVPAPAAIQPALVSVQAAATTAPAKSGPAQTGSANDQPAAESPQASAPPDPMAGLKLQGIFYRLSNRSVLINGQTLFLGDEIEGSKIIGIERKSVRLLTHGQTNVLRRQ